MLIPVSVLYRNSCEVGNTKYNAIGNFAKDVLLDILLPIEISGLVNESVKRKDAVRP